MSNRPEKDEVTLLEFVGGLAIGVLVILPAIAWWMRHLGYWPR